MKLCSWLRNLKKPFQRRKNDRIEGKVVGLDLANYEEDAKEAVKKFWAVRGEAKAKQIALGIEDKGERAGVTGGKNLNGFTKLICDLVHANGLGHAKIHLDRAVVVLPGYFRPTKLWDLLVMNEGRLIAAIELKSQVGPSFGNNFNNRTEEAIGTAHDFAVAYREGALGKQNPPFIGWLMLVEDAPESRRAVRDSSPHFQVFPEFKSASYLKRYDILCERLMKEKLYTAASVMASPRTAITDGAYSDLSEFTSLSNFVRLFAAHIAAEASRPSVNP